MNRTSFLALLILLPSLAVSGCNGARTEKLEENKRRTLTTSFYIINTKGDDIDVRVLADGEELFSVAVPYKGGIRLQAEGPAIIDGPDAKLMRNIEVEADTSIVRVIEKNSGMQQSFRDIGYLDLTRGLTIEVTRDRIRLREGIDLPD